MIVEYALTGGREHKEAAQEFLQTTTVPFFLMLILERLCILTMLLLSTIHMLKVLGSNDSQHTICFLILRYQIM